MMQLTYILSHDMKLSQILKKKPTETLVLVYKQQPGLHDTGSNAAVLLQQENKDD